MRFIGDGLEEASGQSGNRGQRYAKAGQGAWPFAAELLPFEGREPAGTAGIVHEKPPAMRTLRAETKWGLLLPLIAFVLFILYMVLGLQSRENWATGQWVDFGVGLVLLIAVYVLTIREVREKDFGGSLSWRQGFWAGATLTLIMIPVSSFLLWIFTEFINPEYLQIWGEKMVEGGYAGTPGWGTYLQVHVVSSAVIGLLLSLIVPLFLKRKPEN